MPELDNKPLSELTIDEFNQAIEDAQEEALNAWQKAIKAIPYSGYSLMDDVLAAGERRQVDAVHWIAARRQHSDLIEERRSRRRKEKGDA